MSKSEAKKIVRQYMKKLKEADYPFSAVYLFGSHAKGKAKEWSDIDIAVVSDKLKRNYDKNKFKLWHLRHNVDLRIEPHAFTVKEFSDKNNFIAREIKKTGIKVM